MELQKASIIIVTHNHRNYIEPCISSIENEKYPHEIIVVDSLSNDGTYDFVKQRFPKIKLIGCKANLGYGFCNNLGVKHAEGSFIVIINPDTIVKAGWLGELIKPLVSQSDIITTPKILVYDGSAINTCGNINHFTGLCFTRGLGEDPELYAKEECVSGISGCCFAIRTSDYQNLGGFDEAFFLYNEDSDISWRSHLRNFKVIYVPTSVIMHDYELKVSPLKLYHLEKGRYLILRKYLSFFDFMIFLPSLLIVEILIFGYAIKMGRMGLKSKLKAIIDGLTTEINGEKGSKSNLFSSLCVTIPVDQLTFNSVERTVKEIANMVFYFNFKVAV